MPLGRQPLFVARRIYRERRIMDAARVLPLAGAVLFLLPVTWSDDPFHAGSTARGGIYLFAVWAGLVALAAILSRRLVRIAAAEEGRRREAGPAPGDDEDL